MAAQEAMFQAKNRLSSNGSLPQTCSLVSLNFNFLGFHMVELNYMISQVLSFNFILLRKVWSVAY